MPNNSKNVKFGKPKASGGIYFAPAGTDMPTDGATKLGEEFKCLGYMNADGLTETTTREVGEVPAWGGDIVARPQTKYGKTYKFNCIELNESTLAAAFGEGNVEVEANGEIVFTDTSAELPHAVWVFEIMLDAATVLRKVVSDGQVTEVGEIKYVDKDPVSMPITLAVFPDSDGVYVKSYIASISSEPASQDSAGGEG